MTQNEEWTERLYRTIMRAVANAIPANVSDEVDGGLVMFSATGMAASTFLTGLFSQEKAHLLIDQWAKAAHESVRKGKS